MSPIRPTDIQATIPSSTGSICEKLQALFSLATKLSTWWSWAWNSDGTVSDDFRNELHAAGVGVPVGSIVFWPLSSTPSGYLTANGSIVSRTEYPELFGVYGITYGAGDGATTFQLPNLSNRFPMGASSTRTPGSTGGVETVTLSVSNIPEMTISVKSPVTKFEVAVSSGGTNSESAGSALGRLEPDEVFNPLGTASPTAISIINPYLAGQWIIKA